MHLADRPWRVPAVALAAGAMAALALVALRASADEPDPIETIVLTDASPAGGEGDATDAGTEVGGPTTSAATVTLPPTPPPPRPAAPGDDGSIGDAAEADVGDGEIGGLTTDDGGRRHRRRPRWRRPQRRCR